MQNSEVAIIFATSSEEATGSNLFILGYAIYSYGSHFPIAYKLNDRTVLFNKDKYSQTTSRHQRLVRDALESNGWKIIEVDTQTIKQAIREGIKVFGELVATKIAKSNNPKNVMLRPKLMK